MTGHVRVAVVGAGFSGIAAAIELRRRGITDLVILERGSDVGGTWRDNTYPGCACDVQSRIYELAAAPHPDWTRTFSGQAEIQAYLRSVVEIHNLDPHLRLETDVLRAAWDESVGHWAIDTNRGSMSADVLISACGGLVEPLYAEVEGDFDGASMHTARWDHGIDLRGKRIAVVGTGASAIQVVPAIAEAAGQVVVLQRTAPWIMPRHDREIPRWYRATLASVPPLQRASRSLTSAVRDVQVLSFTRGGPFRAWGERMARRHLARQVADAGLRARVTPDYDMGCKRVLVSDDYYPALARDNVVLAPALARLAPTGVVDETGKLHEVDVIIWATGFKVLEPPLASRVIGREGATLQETWLANGMSAYRGTTVSGFPNLYVLLGPNTGLGHSSVVLMSEAQARYAAQAVASGMVLEISQQRQDAYVADIDDRLATTVWQQGRCRSWYQNAHGRNVALWPGSTREFTRLMRRFDPGAYAVTQPKERTHAAT